MFDLEKAIAEWREDALQQSALDTESIRELESHLRDAVERAMERDETPEAAFTSACCELPISSELNAEFLKIYPHVPWQRKALWMLAGYPIYNLILLLIAYGRTFVESAFILLGWTHWIPVPWSYEPDDYDFRFAGVPEGESIHRISLSVLASELFWLMAMGGLIWLIYVLLNRPRNQVTRIVSWVEGNPLRLIATTTLISILAVANHSFWLQGPLYHIKMHALQVSAPDLAQGWEYYSGAPYLTLYSQWVIGLPSALLLLFVCHALKRKLNNDPPVLGLLGYLSLGLIYQGVMIFDCVSNGLAHSLPSHNPSVPAIAMIVPLSAFIAILLMIGFTLAGERFFLPLKVGIQKLLNHPLLAVLFHSLLLYGGRYLLIIIFPFGAFPSHLLQNWILPLISSTLMLALAIRLIRHPQREFDTPLSPGSTVQ